MKWTIIFLFSLYHLNGLAGDWVGNGAKRSEGLFRFSYSNLDEYIQECLRFCELNNEEKGILSQIRESLPRERLLNADQLQFSKDQDLFTLDDQVTRIAVTGNEVGSNIFINLTLADGDQFSELGFESYLAMATSVLIHELGHHHGVQDHQWLDLLGTKVGKIVFGRSQYYFLNPLSSSISAYHFTLSFHEESDSSHDQLVINDLLASFDISAELQKYFVCPKDKKANVIGTRFWNLYWEIEENAQLVLSSQLRLICKHQQEVSDHPDFMFKLFLKFDWEKKLFNSFNLIQKVEIYSCEYLFHGLCQSWVLANKQKEIE